MHPLITQPGSMLGAAALLLVGGCAVLPSSERDQTPDIPGPSLRLLSSTAYPTGAPLEIVAVCHETRRGWVTLADTNAIAGFSVDPDGTLTWLETLPVGAPDESPTSVAVHTGLMAASVPHVDPTRPGAVHLFTVGGQPVARVAVGHHPDMLAFSHDGARLLVVNEGEPGTEPGTEVDPPGSLSVIDLARDGDQSRVTGVQQLAFGTPSASDTALRWTTPLAETPPDWIEPEYAAFSEDDAVAFVTCQENNGVAVVDLRADPPAITALLDLGEFVHTGPHALRPGSGVERLRSLPQPDGIATLAFDGRPVFLTADEGDPRDDWGDDRVAEHDGIECVGSALDEGRTLIFGSRGLTLWSAGGSRLATATTPVLQWLADNRPQSPAIERIADRDHRRGSEPETVVAWQNGDAWMAAAAFERAGAVGLFRVTTDAITTLDVLVLPDGPVDGRTRSPAPEGLALLPAASPDDAAMLLVADERLGRLSVVLIQSGDRPRAE
ncbi:MAG: hypothetical protein AAGF47_06840 [Planctomycetota bacterium]